MSKVFTLEHGDERSADGTTPYVSAASVQIGDPDDDGDRPLQASVSISNPHAEEIDGVHVLLVARDHRGLPVDTFEGDAGQAGAGQQVVVNLSGYLFHDKAEVVSVDIYPQVIDIERVAVAADVVVEDA